MALADQADAQEQRFKDGERELLRLITRLCVATQGLDTMLDPHLKRLHKAAHAGAEGKLQEQAKAFGDSLIQAQEGRASGELFSRMLDRARLGGGQAKAALKLWRKLAGEPSKATDRQLDELASMLFPGAANGGNEKPSGLLGRLLKRDAAAPPNQTLRELINAFEWPAALRREVIDLQVKLKADAAEDAWVDVVREISNLAVNAFDRVHQDAEAASSFLAQLSERLLAIDRFMAGEGDRRTAARDSGSRLGQAVSDEVGDLSANIQAQGDLSQLRAQVLGTLDKIQQHVAVHLQEEGARIDQAEQDADRLREQLQTLEQETFDLRRQVADSHHKAMTDALTGLPNRRAYEDRAEQELARWKRFAKPLALVVWDVDNFKQINDVFGHKAGDRALALIARILHEGMRETDFIARYGGEEFVVLLPGAPQDDALKVANIMRERVANAGMHSHKKPITITLSGGLAMAREGETVEALFERADQAMYQAKQAGKNRVVSA